MYLKKEQMKLLNKIFLLIFLIFLTFGCKTMREGLDASKNKGSEAFLVKKKNPLVLPPSFEKLPKPKTEIKNNNDQTNIENLFRKKELKDDTNDNHINLSIKKLVQKEINKKN